MMNLEVVCGIIRNENGEVLIAQRPAHTSFGGSWEFAGGKIEKDEAPEAALVRELKEELAVDVTVGDHIGIYTHEFSDRTIRLHAYYAHTDQQPVALEHQELMWVHPLSYRGSFLLDSNKPILDEIMLDSLF
ncbi:(deoxy)nucleoside triphosphate pyrophosphohydrolase [Paenibacillus sp. FSL R7-0302]|uniref:(deoxy)nucleoside triphosphate pyrophosphohydrolase n=1 Tax=Paenibacillus sp. FSL R7-0302 TaxID=2921681 RepID=UPI0030F5D4B1